MVVLQGFRQKPPRLQNLPAACLSRQAQGVMASLDL